MLRNEKGRPPATLTTENLWLLPSDIHLSGAEIELSHKIGRETRLKEALAPIIDNFDYIIIDTPPSLGLLSINALSAANWVMVPVQAEYYSLEGFSMLMNSVKMIQRRINRNLKIFGVVMTMVDARSKLQARVRSGGLEHPEQVVQHLHSALGQRGRSTMVRSAHGSAQQADLLRAGAGSLEYWTLAREFHRRVQDMRREFGVRDPSRVSLEAQGRR